MPTSFSQKLKFNNSPETRLDEFDFVGGLVTDVHETKLDPNQSPDESNVVYNATGSIKTRNGYLRYNGNATEAAADQSNTGASTGSLAITTSATYVAQTYQASGAISVVQADVYMGMQTLGQEQYMRGELWATSAGLPTTLLGNGRGQILLVSGTSETAYSFRFRVPTVNAASTTYAIVIKPFIRGSVQSVNQVNVYYRGSTYASGSVVTSSDTGINWTADTNKDLRFVVYSGTGVGGTGLTRFYGSGGTQQLIAKIGASLYRGNDGTGALTAITLGSGVSLASANYMDSTITNGTLLVVDGTNKIQKYRGSTNSNYSTGTLTATNASATITGSGTSWNTSTNAEVGEYIQLPDNKWYRIIAIASNTSLTIEVNYQGATLSGQNYIISPWGEVQGSINSATAVSSLTRPTGAYIENHANRIWNLDGNTLRFSVLDTSVSGAHFNDWDTANNSGSIIIPAGKGDSGTGLYSLNGVLYVFQRRSIWGLYGTSPANFELRNITNEIGLRNRRTLVEYNDLLIFLSDLGVYLFDGSNLKNISDGKVNTLINSWANKVSPSAILWDNKYIISYTPSSGSTNSEALFYDLTRGVFGKFKGIYTGVWSSWTGGTDTGQIYFISSNQGTIYKWNTGGHDDGYRIETYYNTPSLGFKGNVNDKAIKKFYIQQESLGDWDMTVDLFADLSSQSTQSTINLSPGGIALWDVDQWDVDSWSSEGDLITSRIPEFQGIAKFYKFKIAQTGYNEGIEALGITITVRERRLR